MESERVNCIVALLEWDEAAGIAEVLRDELVSLGYVPVVVQQGQRIPHEATFLLTYGPYGQLLSFLAQLEGFPPNRRPVSIHWNTEGVPDLRLPWSLVRAIGMQRSSAEEALYRDGLRELTGKRPFSHLGFGMKRFRYVGDLYHAYRRGWVHLIADSSQIYAKLRSDHGLPTIFSPWGATDRWYEDLQLTRDIDVLWMGNRASRRRSMILDALRDQLRAYGVNLYMADNQENPFIYDETRTEYLNRAKITLNVTRTWFDDNFSRFAMAGPNRSLIVSETMLPHCPYYEPGVHYVAAPLAKLRDTILYYLENEAARQRIVENCYNLMTTRLTMGHSVQTIMQAAAEKYAQSKSI